MTAADLARVRDWMTGLQSRIVAALEAVDGGRFGTDSWLREAEFGGVSRVLEGGAAIERGAVLFSDVAVAQMPPSASARRPELAGRSARAMGVSLVIHPRNPYAPTVHLNVRFFLAGPSNLGNDDCWWFGGGMDLTPVYPFEEDVIAFHRHCKQALEPFGDQWHPRFKRWCDEYFFLPHRNEARGVGGLFFDDLGEPGFETSFAMTQAVGEAFVPAYVPILARRKDHHWGERERAFQLLRRGRYVEFNLLYDRGTVFGLKSGGRAESSLCSMPAEAHWRYDWHPEPGSPEARLYSDFLPARDWV
ncbi:MAG: oxygen-dependent coproporphyrinogen oxidase [Burkholderiaceae bacterium]